MSRIGDDERYSDAEYAYNAEVHRLINEGMKCPVCDSPPAVIEGLIPGEETSARCRNGHMYVLEQEDDG